MQQTTRSLSTAARSYRNQQSRPCWQQNGESQALLSENGQTVSKQLSLLTNACLKSTVYCSDLLILIHCIVMCDGRFLMWWLLTVSCTEQRCHFNVDVHFCILYVDEFESFECVLPAFVLFLQQQNNIHCVSEKMHQLCNRTARNCKDKFWWHLAEIFNSVHHRVHICSCRFAFYQLFVFQTGHRK